MPQTTDGFRATNGSLHSLGEAKGLSFHNFRLLDDRCLCLLMKNIIKLMPEAEIKKMVALNLKVQAVMQLRSNCRDQESEKDHSDTAYRVSGARPGRG
jgi:hypothetical protein